MGIKVMVYRVSALEVPDDEPFRHDALARRPLVEFLVGLIGRAGGPFVLALDSPWGSGKTTLVHMLEAELKRQGFSCIYFNAWQVDYATDPLVALVSSVDRLELSEEGPSASFKVHLTTARRVTTLIAKRAAVAAAKALTVGAIDLEKESESFAAELAGGAVTDLVEAFQKEAVLLEKFRTELAKAVEQLPAAGKRPTLVFFVDEIDRCRPTFAIELLERIKHLFDVANVLFVLSLDKKQLEASVAAVYGQNINAAEYLRRFVDLEYAIPVAKAKDFVESLFERFKLETIFANRTHPDLRNDRSNFVDLFSALADAIPLSLRAQERCMTRLRVVLDQTPPNQHLEPILVAALIVLRASKPELFERTMAGSATAQDIMTYIGALPGGQQVLKDPMSIILEASLIAADNDQNRKASVIQALKASAEDKNEQGSARSGELLEMLEFIRVRTRRSPTLLDITCKIDLASGLR